MEAWPSLSLYLFSREAEVETEANRNQKAFVDGTLRELRKLQTEYYEAEENGASERRLNALKNRILHVADELPQRWFDDNPDVKEFVNSLRNGEVGSRAKETPFGKF